jgi:hypothetical protein
MIPAHEIENTFSYAYVAGCRNALWLVGRVHHIDAENKVVFVSRSNDESFVPVYLEKSDRIPDDLKDGDAVKMICHIYSGIHEGNADDLKAGRHARLVAKYIGRPTLLDMRPKDDFVDVDPDSSSFDDFDLPDVYTAVSNNLEIAGFVDGIPVMVKDQDSERDRMVFMVRQANNPQNFIPIEITGKHASLYRKVVTVGMAVFVTGMAVPAKRNDTGEYVAVVRSNHVRKAVPAKDFKFESVPEWVVDIRLRWSEQVKQAKAARAASEFLGTSQTTM